jgi:hypothetical protein
VSMRFALLAWFIAASSLAASPGEIFLADDDRYRPTFSIDETSTRCGVTRPRVEALVHRAFIANDSFPMSATSDVEFRVSIETMTFNGICVSHYTLELRRRLPPAPMTGQTADVVYWQTSGMLKAGEATHLASMLAGLTEELDAFFVKFALANGRRPALTPPPPSPAPSGIAR